MLDYYIGQVGIRPNEFWSNTWKENQLLGESHTIKLNIQWEQTRYLASMIINVNVDKKSKMVSPEKLFPLPQDIYLEKGKPKSTPEQYNAFKQRVEAMENNLNKD